MLAGFVCVPEFNAPCNPEDVIIDEEEGLEYCKACLPENPPNKARSRRVFNCPNCGEESAPTDLIWHADGNEYCSICLPLDEDDEIVRPQFLAPVKPAPEKKQRERVARVRKVTRTFNDDETIARPQGFSAPSFSTPAPTRHREARIRTVTNVVHGNEDIVRPQGFTRIQTRREREEAEELAKKYLN